MINAVSEAITQKTTNQYMVIEDRYLTLRRYLNLLIKDDNINKRNIEIILKALDNDPIEMDGVKDVEES